MLDLEKLILNNEDKVKKIIFFIIIIFLAVFSSATYASKGEMGHKHGDTHNKISSETPHDKGPIAIAEQSIEAQKHKHDTQSADLRVHAIQKKIEELESEVFRLKAIQQTFTTLMPDFSERFHVMHFAGEAGDWTVAAHEVIEMQRMVKIAKLIEPKKGKLMEAFMDRNLNQLKESIEHANIKSFIKAMNKTIQNCNNCHRAAEAAHIKVSMDMDNLLSIRHSHKFMKTKADSITTHGH